MAAVRSPSDRELVLELAQRLRERVLPELGSHAGRADAGRRRRRRCHVRRRRARRDGAEEFLAERAPRLAFYSEDRGLVAPRGRDRRAGRRSDRRHPAGDGRARVGLRRGGAGAARRRRADDGATSRSAAWSRSSPATGSWPCGARASRSHAAVSLERRTRRRRGCSGATASAAARSRPTVEVLGELIDASSVGGGTFELGSQAFAMTRVVTGQLDAVIEVGSRLIDDVPGHAGASSSASGGGQVLNNSPYDLAAPWLCLREAGGVVSDGWGEPLDRHRLLGSGHEFQMSSISAANARAARRARAGGRRRDRAAARRCAR